MAYLVNFIDKPLLSILLPLHEGEDFLNETLENVINQTFSDFELIILDKDNVGIFKSILQNIKKDRIIILVAHQPEIVNFCDKIYNLK